MIKLALADDSCIILADLHNKYKKNPLFFNTNKEMFDYIEKETGIKSYFINIKEPMGADDRYICEKDKVGMLSPRDLIVYDIDKQADRIIGVCDLGERE